METKCPNCDQLYDIDDEALGQIIECPECKTEFKVESFSSSFNHLFGKKAVKGKDGTHKQTVSKKTIAIILLAVVLLIGCVAGYLLFPSRPSKSRAVENRAKVYYWVIDAKFKVSNKKAVKTICKERSKLELKEAEKQKIEDSFIAFWCDKDVLSFFATLKNLNSNNLSLDEKRAELELQGKRLQEVLDTKHPQNKQILALTDIIEKEYSPIDQIILKYDYARSLFLIEQDGKYSENDSDKMFKDVEKRLIALLYNVYSKDDEIDYPDELRELCANRAKEMISIIQKRDKALAMDWAEIILSDEMKKEMESSLNRTGKTLHALYWLKDFGEKQIPPIPYGCSMDYLLEIDDTWSFWSDYYNVSHYGKKKIKY